MAASMVKWKKNEQQQIKDDKTKKSKYSSKQVYKKRKDNNDRFKHVKGNIKEGQGFADFRKRKILNEYRKILRKEKNSLQDVRTVKSIETDDSNHSTQPHRSKKKFKFDALNRARLEYERKKKDKEKEIKESLQRKAEKEEALNKYKEQKKKKHKVIARKNFKGQPSMASQMDYLLSKIQNH